MFKGLKIFSILTFTLFSLSLIAAHIFISLGLKMLNKSIEVLFKSIFVPDHPFLNKRKVLLNLMGLYAPISK